MDCPVNGVKMRQLQDKGITMDWCEMCDGIWLDAGELTHLTQTARDLPGLPPTTHSVSPQKIKGRPNCPRCRKPLEELPYAEGETLRVDRCADCRGLWLERGELQMIYDHVSARKPLSHAPPAHGPNNDPVGRIILAVLLFIIVAAGLTLLVIQFANR